MAGLCEGDNEPPGSLKANKTTRVVGVVLQLHGTEEVTIRNLLYMEAVADRVLGADRLRTRWEAPLEPPVCGPVCGGSC
ncbi:hypothetical protein ANN_03053 [Periplaneta americana]|uniref:Uncharacterized protein n=1 Tax=Periplaneta americana TaxID=6978 RepID=A0ABQ8TXZ3_PERAM|nr:hypothetical protein ANN_03053 [Periplaneta americana]